MSIHQNSFSASTKGTGFYHKSSEKGKGVLPVFYSSPSKKKRTKKTTVWKKANASYYMLRKVSCPIVIVECGFLSNPDEERLLNDEKYQKRWSKGL